MFKSYVIPSLHLPLAAVSGAEDVALYVGMVAVALCLTLLLIVVVLVYRRKKEGLDADVADSSILTTGFQPMGIKPSKPGVWAPRPRRPPHSSRTLFFVLPSCVRLATVTVQYPSTCSSEPVLGFFLWCERVYSGSWCKTDCVCFHVVFTCLPDAFCFATTSF